MSQQPLQPEQQQQTRTFVIVDRHTGAIKEFYEDESVNFERFAVQGKLGWSNYVLHLPIPDDVDRETIRIIQDQSTSAYQVEVDPKKLEARKEVLWKELRRIRNERLRDSDWTQVIDAPLTEEQQLEWQQYRKNLRALSQTVTDATILSFFKNEKNWPMPPS